ncbi:MAG: sulfite exporter TauE/SafE family protein [Myxococcales bacterium]|nr:sulfite exporter TauE/SafE family protein [Myxococcales bacterium]
MELTEALVLVGVGAAAGVVNTIAGGGSFVTVPALMWAGVPVAVANGTNRVGVLAQTMAAVGTFRAEMVDGGGELVPQIALTGAGALLGSLVAVWLPPEALETAIGVFMLVLVLLAMARPSQWSEPAPPSPWRWPALFVIGAYGGFLQAGVGLVLLPCLVRLGGLDPVRANARKSLLVATLTVPAIATFAAAGVVWWGTGAILAVGASIGAVVGARLTTRLGPRFVWAVLLVVAAATLLRKLL